MFRFILGIQMVEITEEFIEAMDGRQEFVAVAEMVLAELSGRVSLRLQEFGDSWVFSGKSFLRSGRPTFRSPVRNGLCPVMNAARPAVQDCCP